MLKSVGVVIVVVSALLGLCVADFKNPIFNSQDPWVTFVDGVYYYSESYCGAGDICVKSSKTLTGLSSAPWVGVWSHSGSGPNQGDIWAPEIHYVKGGWYIYYAADNGDNNNHRLFVLSGGNNPTGKYVEANTGLAHGQLRESTGHWAIDPDVFVAADGELYITWSCTNFANSNFPQRICLAHMSDAVTIGPTTYLSTPTEPWERRGADIQEGPVGYTMSGHTYITYSGSASWISNDYSVGLLTHTGGNILDANNWKKSGPIFDHHGSTYGPGSVVFTPSPDGSEYYNMYHAIEKPDCSPNAYACRDIRMQQMWFDQNGYPILGYPVNPGVAQRSPAGENGVKNGTKLIANWGNAWGDAAEGNNNNGLIAGKWTNLTDRWTASSTVGGGWDQIFSPWNPNPASFTAHVEVQHVATGSSQDYPKYGFYCSYSDANNHAELMIDIKYNVLASHAVVGGKDEGWQNANLPANFNANAWHTLECAKSGSTYTFSLDGGAVKYSRNFGLENGQTGLVVVDTQANYRNLQLYT